MIRVAVAKGYLLGKTAAVFAQLGVRFSEPLTETRQLQLMDTSGRYMFILVRPWDVPVFVANGAADIGIVGEDVLAEQKPNVARLLDLNFGACQLVLAGLSPGESVKPYSRVATKYPRLTESYFQTKHCPVSVLKLYGSIESAPVTGLADYIVDLTATGATLKANGLHCLDTLVDATAILIANPVRLRFLHADIHALVAAVFPLV